MGYHAGKIGDISFDVDEAFLGKVSDEEIKAYIDRYRKNNPEKQLTHIKIKGVENSDEVLLEYKYKPISFERIRRITGYLVGDMNKWNDAKTAECADRVKHNVFSEALEATCNKQEKQKSSINEQGR